MIDSNTTTISNFLHFGRRHNSLLFCGMSLSLPTGWYDVSDSVYTPKYILINNIVNFLISRRETLIIGCRIFTTCSK